MENKIYPTIKNSILLCLLFVGIQLGLGLIVGIIQVALGLADESLLICILTTLAFLIPFGIVLLIGLKKAKRKINEIFKFNKVSTFLWLAIIIFMIGFVIVTSEADNFLNYILPMPEFFRGIFDSLMTKQPFVFALIIVGIIPAIMEELLFRGLILDGLDRNYPKRKAIVISAVLFGIIHLNPWQFYSGFIIGLISAWICIETKSIVLCMYIHFLTMYCIQ